MELPSDDRTTYGIAGHKAPELHADQWIGANGIQLAPVKLSDFDGRFKVVYCFQSWCQGCHSSGFPALQKMTTALEKNKNVVFMAVQTVFEGYDANTFEKITEIQNQYGLGIPFGHDPGDKSSYDRSKIMYHYRTGGTPWFIFIDQKNTVVFNDFHLDAEKAIAFLKAVS